ncbi:MAG: type effector protein AvrRpm1 [Paraburkholderia sp.]|jgi:hypothetical protein|nr:type effector protein AvrRpm1 [Paraburkholderia sp.]
MVRALSPDSAKVASSMIDANANQSDQRIVDSVNYYRTKEGQAALAGLGPLGGPWERTALPADGMPYEANDVRAFRRQKHAFGSSMQPTTQASGSAPPSHLDPSQTTGIPPETLAAARRAYRSSLLYHGTTLGAKDAIRRGGFEMRNKSGGATTGSPFLAANARAYHYLTTSKDVARGFAEASAWGRPSETPAIVRTVGVARAVPLESDPDSDSNMHAVRTPHDIAAYHVIGSKKGVSGQEGYPFSYELAQQGVSAHPHVATRLLHEVASDSDDDFSPSPPLELDGPIFMDPLTPP